MIQETFLGWLKHENELFIGNFVFVFIHFLEEKYKDLLLPKANQQTIAK